MSEPSQTQEAPFARFAANVHSQFGEDGIIAAILEKLPETDKWAVEFGAWDGVLMSNTAALAERGWSRVLIEGDRKKYDKLVSSYAGNPSVVPLCAMVGWEGPDTLDGLLARTPIPQDFDILSIDIDGNDYYVWEAVEAYRPKLVVIEYNPTIRNGVDYVQPPDPSMHRSSSITALARLATAKGYRLAATTPVNGLFVRDDLFEHLGVEDDSVDALRTESWHSEVFFGFDGHAVFLGGRGLLWHGLDVPSDVRMVPRIFDGFPAGDHGKIRRGMLKVWAARQRRRNRR